MATISIRDRLWMIRLAAKEKHTTQTESTLELIERLATEALACHTIAPCPYCGTFPPDEATRTPSSRGPALGLEQPSLPEHPRYFVICTQCSSRGPIESAEDEAVRKWNAVARRKWDISFGDIENGELRELRWPTPPRPTDS